MPAGGTAFTGFVITGTTPQAVLVRAVGPGLGAFSISDALRDPKLVLTANGQRGISNDDWETSGATAIARTSAVVGAFPLASASKDAALIATLPPGAYVAEVTAANGTDTGQVLVEVYLLP